MGATVTVNVVIGGKTYTVELPQSTTINGRPYKDYMKGSVLNISQEQAAALLGIAYTDDNKKSADINDIKNSQLLEQSVNKQLEKINSIYRVGDVDDLEGTESGIFKVSKDHVIINMTPDGKEVYEDKAKFINIDFNYNKK